MSAETMLDPRFVAVVDLIGRSGATGFQIRWSDEPEPTVWIAVAQYRDAHEAAAALDPVTAALRLAEVLVDGGFCTFCRRPAGVTDQWEVTQPLAEHICWYVYDPEVKKFRRSCEGDDHAQVGRNDPCPCGSGRKFKNCHAP